MAVLIELGQRTQSHRMVRMCLASLTQIVGGATDHTEQHHALAATAEFAAKCLSCSPRADDWLILSSQSGLFCVSVTVLQRTVCECRSLPCMGSVQAHDQVKVLAAELAFALSEPRYCRDGSLVDALIGALSVSTHHSSTNSPKLSYMHECRAWLRSTTFLY